MVEHLEDVVKRIEISPYSTYDEIKEKHRAFLQNEDENFYLELHGLKFKFESYNQKSDDNHFTTHHYEKILHRVSKLYTTSNFHSFKNNSTDPIILWRHDVDISVTNALQLAYIEKKYHVQSTYFIMLNSTFYNIRNKETREMLLDIHSLGHQLGLHYDASYLIDETLHDINDFEKTLIEQKSELERILKIPIDVFSLHDPAALSPNLFNSIKENQSWGGMLNVYSNDINNQFHYVSDSNGIWRHGDVEEYLYPEKYPYLHVLTHPVWWSRYPLSPRKKILNALLERLNSTMSNYDATLKKQNRVNY